MQYTQPLVLITANALATIASTQSKISTQNFDLNLNEVGTFSAAYESDE